VIQAKNDNGDDDDDDDDTMTEWLPQFLFPITISGDYSKLCWVPPPRRPPTFRVDEAGRVLAAVLNFGKLKKFLNCLGKRVEGLEKFGICLS